jgi:hypothetical protein
MGKQRTAKALDEAAQAYATAFEAFVKSAKTTSSRGGCSATRKLWLASSRDLAGRMPLDPCLVGSRSG